MAGDILHVPALKGLGAATGASPAPRVFSSMRGLEPYSMRFFIEWRDEAGAERSLRLTPEVYARMRGPYNRRNVYGAVLAAGPVLVSEPLTRPLFHSVTSFALCGPSPVLRELGLDLPRTSVRRVRYEPVAGTGMGRLPRTIEVHCP